MIDVEYIASIEGELDALRKVRDRLSFRLSVIRVLTDRRLSGQITAGDYVFQVDQELSR